MLFRSITPSIVISVEGEIAINCAISRRRDLAKARSQSTLREIAIDASRDRAVDRDLRSDHRTGAREIDATWSSESAGDHRTDWNVSSPLARVRALSLSLFFRKCFEVKMRGENHFRIKGENIGQPEVIFWKISFSVTAKHAGLEENDFRK